MNYIDHDNNEIGPAGWAGFDYTDCRDLIRAEEEAKTRKCRNAPELLTRIRTGDPTAPAAMIEGHEYLIYDVAQKSAGSWMQRKKPDGTCFGGDWHWLYRSLLPAAMEGLYEAVKRMREHGPDANANAIEKYIRDNCYRNTGEYMLNETNVAYVPDDKREYAKRINAPLPQVNKVFDHEELIHDEMTRDDAEPHNICHSWRWRVWANVLHLMTNDREYDIVNRLLDNCTDAEITAALCMHPRDLLNVRRGIGQQVLEALSLAEPGNRQTQQPRTPAKYYCWSKIIAWEAKLEPKREWENVAA